MTFSAIKSNFIILLLKSWTMQYPNICFQVAKVEFNSCHFYNNTLACINLIWRFVHRTGSLMKVADKFRAEDIFEIINIWVMLTFC